MPELPEVEITRRSFASRITGARIEQVRLGKPLRWPLGVEPGQLQGAQVLDVRRRGKYLLLDLTLPGAREGLLLMHLGMSGSLQFASRLGEPGKHDHFDLVTSQGALRLHDPRRFGAVVFAQGQDDPVAKKLLSTLGPEPWDGAGVLFDARLFHAALKKRSAAIKQVLLQGQAVVGVGNIYASEALFLAGIAPTCKAQKISFVRVQKLRDAIGQVLGQAISQGGSTLRDFRSADGQDGHFQESAQVYGREGQPCFVCGGQIRKITQGQRSTWFCPSCQRR
jgi:formamidopyrimidine-DNA glycosylase